MKFTQKIAVTALSLSLLVSLPASAMFDELAVIQNECDLEVAALKTKQSKEVDRFLDILYEIKGYEELEKAYNALSKDNQKALANAYSDQLAVLAKQPQNLKIVTERQKEATEKAQKEAAKKELAEAKTTLEELNKVVVTDASKAGAKAAAQSVLTADIQKLEAQTNELAEPTTSWFTTKNIAITAATTAGIGYGIYKWYKAGFKGKAPQDPFYNFKK